MIPLITGRLIRHRARRASSHLLAVALALAATGCRPRATPVEQANAENILLLGNGAEPSDLDPQTITGSPEVRIVLALFEGLTRYHPATLDPLPGVAERWDVSDDARTFTFHLRPDAVWSDGVPITAQTFVESYRRILNPLLGSDNAEGLYFLTGAEAYNKGNSTDFATVGVRAIDDHTLELRCHQPTPFLVRMLSARSWMPVPIHVLQAHDAMERKGTAWTREQNIVSNGPFLLASWQPNQVVELVPNPSYWNREIVSVDRVRLFPIENVNAEEAAYRADQLHRTSTVPIAKIETYQQERPDELHIIPFSGTYYYAFNVTRPPLDDPRVRQALAYAVDRKAIVREVSRGGEEPAGHFLPDNVSGYVSPVPGIDLNLDKARQLLADAGYPGGEGFRPITLLYNSSENHRVMAEAVQQMWRRELGIDVRLENQEWKVYLDNMHLGNFDLARAGYIVAPDDPTRFLEGMRTGHGFNISKWSDPEYDAWLAESLSTVDTATREALFARMQQRLIDAMPIAPIYHYTNKYLLRPEVKHWSDNMLAEYPLREVVLDP